MTKLETPVFYICEKFPSLAVRFDKKRYKFNNHELRITTQEEVDTIDEILEENSILASKIRKVDKTAAEEFVKSLLNKNTHRMAVKGPVSAQDIIHAQTPIDQRDANLTALQPDQLHNLTKELADDNSFIMTEKAKNPETSSVDKPKETKISLGLKEYK